MTPDVELALVSAGSAVAGGLVAALSTYAGVSRQLGAQRAARLRQEQLQVMTEFVQATVLYIDEYEYWVAGRDDLLERGGPERLDAQRSKVDELNTERRRAYASLPLVCSDDLATWLAERLAAVEEAFEAQMGAAFDETDPSARFQGAARAGAIYRNFVDEALNRLKQELIP